jgi:hypothetical protein
MMRKDDLLVAGIGPQPGWPAYAPTVRSRLSKSSWLR